jgi:hypothetical protein
VQSEPVPYNIIGKSQTVYLEEPPAPKIVEPVFSEDLQRVPAYEEEPDITADDVDDNLGEEILTDEERFTPLDTDVDSEVVSTGMTYEQISEALEVVQGKKTDDADKLAAARTLYEVQGSDLFNFLTVQAENEAIIEKLLKENLDNAADPADGNIKKQQRKIEEFDMGKYV